MNLQEAINILIEYQNYRINNNKDFIFNPKKLNEALDIVLKFLQTIQINEDSTYR